jgi:hypothetical protein
MKRTRLPFPASWSLLGALALPLLAPACDEGSPVSPGSERTPAGSDDSVDTKAATGSLGLSCSPGVDPPDPRITEFAAADFDGNKGKWSGDRELTLFVYDYHDPNSSSSNKLDAESFNFSGQVVPGAEESYAGGGMHFDSGCVNTTRYRGIQYTLTGTSSGCSIYFNLQTYSQQALNEKGGCASFCYHFPNVEVTPRSTPITVLFSDLDGTGIPSSAAAMASEIMGIRWQLELAPGQGDACSFSLTVDDVKFVQ